MPSYRNNYDEDYDLVEQCQKGSKKAFGDLIIKYQQKVFDQCYWLLLSRDDAEDAAQEVFLKVIKNIKKFEGKSKFSTWLYTIARNNCLNILKRRGRLELIDHEEQEEILTVIDQEQRRKLLTYDSQQKSKVEACVEEKLAQLDEKHRSVVVLVHLQGLSYEEAAEVLDCPIGTIRSRLSRSLERLKPKLKECYELLE